MVRARVFDHHAHLRSELLDQTDLIVTDRIRHAAIGERHQRYHVATTIANRDERAILERTEYLGSTHDCVARGEPLTASCVLLDVALDVLEQDAAKLQAFEQLARGGKFNASWNALAKRTNLIEASAFLVAQKEARFGHAS